MHISIYAKLIIPNFLESIKNNDFYFLKNDKQRCLHRKRNQHCYVHISKNTVKDQGIKRKVCNNA